MKQRQGVLGLDTAKAVIVSFLILAITGIAIILALTSLQTAGSSTIDTSSIRLEVINESDYKDPAFINRTGYTLSGYNSSWSGITLIQLWNSTDEGGTLDGNWNYTLLLENATIIDGIVYNATTEEYQNVSISYYYSHSFNNGRTNSIVGNVSGGIVTFFGSTGTIFSILIVVVIILAISIIIWAVGRFGQQTERAVNL